MKCKIIIKPKQELSSTIKKESYQLYSFNHKDENQNISISTESNNTLVLIVSNGNIIHNKKIYPKFAIVPMKYNCSIDIEIFYNSKVFCYDLDDDMALDMSLRLHKFTNPYYYIIEQLLDDLKDNIDDIIIMSLKHMALLSLTQNKTISDYSKIKQFIFTNIKNTSLSLDYLSDNLFMSRRKIQYILSRNNTTYGLLVDDIRFDILSQEKLYPGVTLQQILIKAGIKNIATANRIFLKKVGIKMRDFLTYENE